MQKNKFPSDFLKNFKGIFKKIITVKIPNEKNACSAENLKSIAVKQKYSVEIYVLKVMQSPVSKLKHPSNM